MNKTIKYICVIIFSVIFLVSKDTVGAVENPLGVANNKFGIHVIDENDLENASVLVNSSGGDWGYVTIVITQNDRNLDKWQNALDKMRRLHLIPIVRLATQIENGVWKKPELSQVNSWADFLSNLRWVTKNKYVIIFNEPNHAKEWGGVLNPLEYAQILDSYSSAFKNKSSDFFILPAGLDASASNSWETMDESSFLRGMIDAKPDIFTKIDGWNSHSYPNPGFAGSVNAYGRGTLRTYQWETNLLAKMGFPQKLPIFITETGWPHAEGISYNRGYLSSEKVADYIQLAAERIWSDENIVAITPFVLNYQSHPFSNFSWQLPNDSSFYPQFDVYRALLKVAGSPILEEIKIEITPSPTIVEPSGEPAILPTKNENSSLVNKLFSLFLKKPLDFFSFLIKAKS